MQPQIRKLISKLESEAVTEQQTVDLEEFLAEIFKIDRGQAEKLAKQVRDIPAKIEDPA